MSFIMPAYIFIRFWFKVLGMWLASLKPEHRHLVSNVNCFHSTLNDAEIAWYIYFRNSP